MLLACSPALVFTRGAESLRVPHCQPGRSGPESCRRCLSSVSQRLVLGSGRFWQELSGFSALVGPRGCLSRPCPISPGVLTSPVFFSGSAPLGFRQAPKTIGTGGRIMAGWCQILTGCRAVSAPHLPRQGQESCQAFFRRKPPSLVAEGFSAKECLLPEATRKAPCPRRSLPGGSSLASPSWATGPGPRSPARRSTASAWPPSRAPGNAPCPPPRPSSAAQPRRPTVVVRASAPSRAGKGRIDSTVSTTARDRPDESWIISPQMLSCQDCRLPARAAAGTIAVRFSPGEE